MKKLLLLLILVTFYISTTAQTEIELDWLNTATSYYNGGDVQILDMATSDDSSIVAVGYFVRNADFDPSGDTFNLSARNAQDIFIAKYNKRGALVYAYNFGGEDNESDEAAYSVAVDEAGNTYVTGTFRNTIDFDPGPGTKFLTAEYSDEIFIASYNAAGALNFAINVADTKSKNKINIAKSIVLDNDNNIYITGIFGGDSVDFDPGLRQTLFTSTGGQDISLLNMTKTELSFLQKQFTATE